MNRRQFFAGLLATTAIAAVPLSSKQKEVVDEIIAWNIHMPDGEIIPVKVKFVIPDWRAT